MIVREWEKDVEERVERHSFKPRARLMLLLGDELIKDAGIAVFELVKNAYDADATECSIFLQHVDEPGDNSSIVVSDNGCGMSLQTVLGVWLEPGTENRKRQRVGRVRTPLYSRLPLGEKGVGRFAVHKLGQYVQMVTKSSKHEEVVVTIDWSEFDRSA